ncbi:MAG TPA: hypothetical protein VFS43_31985 [Polyangiaceae bacterium]|nr:hypothetical protein [Polyangiaceae bacterium]
MALRTRRLLAALAALALALILYLCFARLLWAPFSRALEIEVRSEGPGTLTVARDVGRQFYEGDAVQRALGPGRETVRLALTPRATALKVSVSAEAKGAIERVTLDGETLWTRPEGAAGEGAPSTDAIRLARPPFRPPPAKLALAAALALVASALLARAAARAAGPRPGEASPEGAARAAPLAGASWAALARSAALFAAFTLVCGYAAQGYVILFGSADVPPYWPISIFDPEQPSARALIGALALGAALAVGLPRALAAGPWHVAGLAFAALVASSALPGWYDGLVEPTDMPGSYWRHAGGVTSPSAYVERFLGAQRSLGVHARVHPPGAVLAYWLLRRLVPGPGAASLAIGALSLAVTAAASYRLARRFYSPAAARFYLGALLLAPALQVYLLASLDALVCALFVAAVACFLEPNPWARYGGTAVLVVAAASLSFAALFLPPVLLALDLYERRSAKAFAAVLALCLFAYARVRGASGYDWYASLAVASHLENPQGFRGFSATYSYLFTRLEGVTELLLFASPPLAFAAARASGRPRTTPVVLALAAAGTLAAMLLSGAFKTGETARACLFIYPLCLLPLAGLVDGGALDGAGQHRLLRFVAGQTVLMQLVGDYYW